MESMTTRTQWVVLALLLAVGCGDNPVSSSGDVTGMARVRAVELAVLESFPVQIHLTAKGELGDACTKLGEIKQSRDGERIAVEITTSRPADAVCAAVLVMFEEVVPLDVVGLPAGTYEVDVNGVTTTFTLTTDNTLSVVTTKPTSRRLRRLAATR